MLAVPVKAIPSKTVVVVFLPEPMSVTFKLERSCVCESMLFDLPETAGFDNVILQKLGVVAFLTVKAPQEVPELELLPVTVVFSTRIKLKS